MIFAESRNYPFEINTAESKESEVNLGLDNNIDSKKELSAG